ncbi:amidohydrolase family protein [Agromyces albus]|uniref:amidohydrolase family protein n=1 Tax=Agromyces albus TaxID=205332 RepID=UPI0027806A2F|nr:amidohydrolase family protein [Agromyces albus]MDQ0573857.1 L-fuconolactonase [Agromyces albus]
MTLIDSHVHVWDPRRLPYAWLAGTELDRPVLPQEVDRAGGTTTGMIFVEAGGSDPLDEARWVDESEWPELIAIVAGADLTLEASAVSDHLNALAALPRVVGVRHLLQDTPVEDFPSVAEGLRVVEAHGARFDACIRHAQLPALIELLAVAPNLTVILDHLGKPPVDEGIGSTAGRAWARNIESLAERPDTFVKLSGMTAESTDPAAFARHADGWIEHALAVFGPERAMVGSDWPVSATFGIGGAFEDWVDRVRRVVGDTDWPTVSAETARRAYLPGGGSALRRMPS